MFGGSFDPPHPIHIRMLKKAIELVKPNKIIVVPTYISPFKKNHLFSYTDRKSMLRNLLKKMRLNFTISDFEYKRKRKTYTWMLINHLKRKYPNCNIYFLIGSDNIEKINEWKRSDYLIKNLTFVVAERDGYPLKKSAYQKLKILKIKERFTNLSSTQIRDEIFLGNLKNLAPQTKAYIEKKLRIKKLLNTVKKLMTPSRWNHTMQTIKLSTKLAWIYGADTKKAFLAALFHDCAKDLDIETQIKLAIKSKMKIKRFDDIIKHAPQIIHQWASVAIVRDKFKIHDKDILSSISKHATGSRKMSLLDMIVYVSDIASPDRDFKEASEIRKEAFKNIKKAFEKAKKIKLKYVKKKKGFIYEN